MLGGDPAAVGLVGVAVAQRPLDAAAVADQLGGQVGGQLGQVGRALAAQRGHRLLDLERVADRPAQRLVHARQQRASRPCRGRAPTAIMVARQLAGRRQVGHEGAVAHLDVEHAAGWRRWRSSWT